MKQKPLIYIAGPITKGDHPSNIRNGIDAYKHVLDIGGLPFCPMLDFLVRIVYPKEIDYELLLDYDFQVISYCSAVIRIPGESAGADREEKFAKDNNIPFFTSWESLAMWIINNYGEKEYTKPNGCCGYSD